MNLIQSKQVRSVPEIFRNSYLDSLTEPQEFHVENLVRAGQAILLLNKGEEVGYAVINGQFVVEFFISEKDVGLLPMAFDFVLKNYNATRALAKTFDPLMVAAAASKPAKTRTTAFLFRKLLNFKLANDLNVTVRPGKMEDVDLVLSMHDGFFDSPEEIRSYSAESGLFLYETKGGGVLGCGIFKRIITDRKDVDVGMVVAPSYRRKGIGSYIVADMGRRCLSSGFRPVCGCSADNLASRRTLERAGFLTKHSLVEFRY